MGQKTVHAGAQAAREVLARERAHGGLPDASVFTQVQVLARVGDREVRCELSQSCTLLLLPLQWLPRMVSWRLTGRDRKPQI